MARNEVERWRRRVSGRVRMAGFDGTRAGRPQAPSPRQRPAVRGMDRLPPGPGPGRPIARPERRENDPGRRPGRDGAPRRCGCRGAWACGRQCWRLWVDGAWRGRKYCLTHLRGRIPHSLRQQPGRLLPGCPEHFWRDSSRQMCGGIAARFNTAKPYRGEQAAKVV